MVQKFVTGFISLLAKSTERPCTTGAASATRSTSKASIPTQRPYSDVVVSIGVVSSTRLRTGLSAPSSAACIAHSAPPMHHPTSDTSS